MSPEIESFHRFISEPRRILVVCGAGLGASSGLPTFRGSGGMWRHHNALELSTHEAFRRDPGLVWQFHSQRRHAALKALPNAAHYALAELARRRPYPDFLMLTHNTDGLSDRAGHPRKSVEYLHGSLFRVRCSRSWCKYERLDVNDPIVPALAVPADPDEAEAWGEVSVDDLPKCPVCQSGLLRPCVAWIGETPDSQMLKRIDQFLVRPGQPPVDLCIMLGTSGTVYPAAGYASKVKEQGGKVAVVDLDCSVRHVQVKNENADWLFEGDAAQLIPVLLEPIIGQLNVPKTPPRTADGKDIAIVDEGQNGIPPCTE